MSTEHPETDDHDADADRFLDTIVWSTDLLGDDEPHLRDMSPSALGAVASIRGYMHVLEASTGLPQSTLKDLLGCRKDIHELQRYSQDELVRSQEFLAYITELILAVERPDTEAAGLIPFFIRVYRALDRDIPLAHAGALYAVASDGTPVTAALRSVEREPAAYADIIAFSRTSIIDTRTSTGRRVVYPSETARLFGQAVLDGSFAEMLGGPASGGSVEPNDHLRRRGSSNGGDGSASAHS